MNVRAPSSPSSHRATSASVTTPIPTNWGAVATFNHAYVGGPEPYASLLEDDNWWDSDFLATAVRALDAHPSASLVWANMKLWQERNDGTWHDTGRTIWRLPPTVPSIIEFRGPELLQAFDALHSNGAMVFRPRFFRSATVPAALPFSIVEQARERAATGPLLLLTAPLAHFACTLATARDSDSARWLQAKLLVAASFFQKVPVPSAALAQMWTLRRAHRPRDTGIFFCLALALRNPKLLAPARAADWLHFLLGAARHPLRLARGLSFRRDQPEAWAWFLAQTEAEPSLPRPRHRPCQARSLMSTARILVVTNGHLCRNPRPLKEAVTLGRAGYEVTVLTIRNHAASEATDVEILRSAPFRRIYRRCDARLRRFRTCRVGPPRSPVARAPRRRAPSRFATMEALGPARTMLRHAASFRADLTIVHNEVPHWVGTRLLAQGHRVAADIEDWHSEDLLPS
jgi:hypothetical protein